MESAANWCYNLTAMKNQNTDRYCTPIQLKLPIDFTKIIDISDPVYTFNEVLEHVDLRKYYAEEKGRKIGRPSLMYRKIRLLGMNLL